MLNYYWYWTLSNKTVEKNESEYNNSFHKMLMTISSINTLWPSDLIWWHKSGWTLAEVMACCLTAPSHYLNQCWVIISEVLTTISQELLNISILDMSLKITNLRLTHWGRVTHICVGKLSIIGSDNGLSPGRRQAIIWKKCSNIVNWTLRNKVQWNLNPNSYIFIQENVSEKYRLESSGHFVSASMC